MPASAAVGMRPSPYCMPVCRWISPLGLRTITRFPNICPGTATALGELVQWRRVLAGFSGPHRIDRSTDGIFPIDSVCTCVSTTISKPVPCPFLSPFPISHFPSPPSAARSPLARRMRRAPPGTALLSRHFYAMPVWLPAAVDCSSCGDCSSVCLVYKTIRNNGSHE